MIEQPRKIFVDFNRLTTEPDTYVTWGAAFKGGRMFLGESVIMTDLEELEIEGYVSWVSADGKDVHVTCGITPVGSVTRLGAIAPRDGFSPIPVESVGYELMPT